jgi:hypothetical protein
MVMEKNIDSAFFGVRYIIRELNEVGRSIRNLLGFKVDSKLNRLC